MIVAPTRRALLSQRAVEVVELVFLEGEAEVLRTRLDRAEVCVGSNPTADVVVPDPSVPDVAVILQDMGAHRFLLRDLTAGQIHVNGAPAVEEQAVGDGDRFGPLGPYSLKLQVRREIPRHRFGQTRIMGDDERRTERAYLSHGRDRYEISSLRPFNIGGHEDNELALEDPYVSAFHCRIVYQNGRWYISDLESTNGTEVNGLRVREAELPEQATIRIGHVALTFQVPDIKEIANEPFRFRSMVARSRNMQEVFENIVRLAQAREPVLVLGESGSGKELVARALHDESSRAKQPYLALNCGALTPTLIESELFGYVKGAFTGANSDKAGAFESSSGGTLFLDEIGELPLELQPKLLRVLETYTVRRLGGSREIDINVRIIAATHRNLQDLVAEGRFREDLFHRLYVLTLMIPPLRERPADVLLLAEHFLATQAPNKMTITQDAKEVLQHHPWPGNVRELRNVITRAILSGNGQTLQAKDIMFSQDIFGGQIQDAHGLARRMDFNERERVLQALERNNGNQARAARELGFSKSTFHDKLKRLGLLRPRDKDG